MTTSRRTGRSETNGQTNEQTKQCRAQAIKDRGEGEYKLTSSTIFPPRWSSTISNSPMYPVGGVVSMAGRRWVAGQARRGLVHMEGGGGWGWMREVAKKKCVGNIRPRRFKRRIPRGECCPVALASEKIDVQSWPGPP